MYSICTFFDISLFFIKIFISLTIFCYYTSIIILRVGGLVDGTTDEQMNSPIVVVYITTFCNLIQYNASNVQIFIVVIKPRWFSNLDVHSVGTSQGRGARCNLVAATWRDSNCTLAMHFIEWVTSVGRMALFGCSIKICL